MTFVGTAGWAIGNDAKSQFPDVGSHLVRYAQRLNAVEINSSFYRPHQPKTYAKWAESVPDDFRFAVKVPKSITHDARLIQIEDLLTQFASEVQTLGHKLGVLLVQLPPSLHFHAPSAQTFFHKFAEAITTPVACEPRHPSWFTDDCDDKLQRWRVARVAADPAGSPAAAAPGGWSDIHYYRLHGSPRMYYSNYEEATLTELAARLTSTPAKNATWCLFDNTAAGHALQNALELTTLLTDGEAFGAG